MDAPCEPSARDKRAAQVRRWLVWSALLAPAALAGLAYLPTLGHQFVWDDNDLIYRQPFLRDPSLWVDALRRWLSIISPNYFRPLAVVTFLLEARFGGISPGVFHLTNVVLHACNTLLVTLLAFELFKRRLAAPSATILSVAAGLVYGWHPALVESVSFISSRFDLLMTAWLTLALYADIRWRGHRILHPLAIGGLFLAAALTKESAAVFPLVFLLWKFALDPAASPQSALHRLRSTWSDWLALVVAGLVYLGLRWAALGYLYYPNAPSALPMGDFLQRGLLVARSLVEYAAVTFFPFTTLTPLHFAALPIPLTDTAAWLSLALTVAFLAALTWTTQRRPSVGALAGASLVALLPAFNLLPLELSGGTFAAERYLTFPLVLLTLAAGSAVAQSAASPRAPQAIAAGVTVWLIASVTVVEVTLPHWHDSLSLWTWASDRAPASSLPHVNLSNYYIDRGDNVRVLAEADAALQRDPASAMAWNNRGVALFNTSQYSNAQSAWEKATQLEPGNALFWNNLANVRRVQGQWQEAERILINQALRLDPNLALAHFSLGVLYLDVDRPDLAIAPLERAIQILPPDRRDAPRAALAQTREPVRWLRLGNAMYKSDDTEGARRAYAQARSLGASPADIAVSQSAALIELRAWMDAENVLKDALPLAPEDARLYNNLGVVARARGDIRAARDYYARAVSLAPSWDLPRQNLKALDSTP